MPNRRTYTDDQLRDAVASSTNWAQVMRAIGKTYVRSVDVEKVAVRMGLDTSHFAPKRRNFVPVPGTELPFSNPPKPGGQSGLSIAARWFLDRGYIVSVPLEPTVYDLVVESDDGLKRVQVKTTRCARSSGRYVVSLSRNVYDATLPYGANGPRKRVPYEPGSVDYFFIVAPNTMYLMPFSVTSGYTQLVLDEKYAAFAIKP